MKKKIPRKGYRTLALVWMLAAAAMAVAVVRRLPDLSPMPLFLLVVSLLIAVNFWKTYKRAPEGDETNNDSEENDHE